MKVTQSCPALCDPRDYSPWNSPGQNTGVGSLSLLQGIFPTQGSNPVLLHCRQILYQLSHKGSPPKKVLKKVIFKDCYIRLCSLLEREQYTFNTSKVACEFYFYKTFVDIGFHWKCVPQAFPAHLRSSSL